MVERSARGHAVAACEVGRFRTVARETGARRLRRPRGTPGRGGKSGGGGAALEAAGRLTTVVFGETGTITRGGPYLPSSASAISIAFNAPPRVKLSSTAQSQ